MISHSWQDRIRMSNPVRRTGRVRHIRATYLETEGPALPLGAMCQVAGERHGRSAQLLAEVVRVSPTLVTLAPLENGIAIAPDAEVVGLPSIDRVAVGPEFLGRVIDALGRPLDGRPGPSDSVMTPLQGRVPAPLERHSSREQLVTGLRSIDGLLPLSRGQRVGVFAAAGVGKTSLTAQLASQIEADRVVIALIGERGREVEALWSGFDAQVRSRTTLVAATADHPALARVRAADYAMALAEYWRDQGQHVLLLVDSATRLAMALREIGLAAGEPPTIRAYTPNVFAAIPRYVERAGAIRDGGSISAVLTVLSETDDLDDPVCEMMKSLLDGHILLSRALADRGHFPAIDVPRSVSRQADRLRSPAHIAQSRRITSWVAALERSTTIRQAGLYATGSDPLVDDAVRLQSEIDHFLRQELADPVGLRETWAAMARLCGEVV
jgi:flagellum-specific ATP synthase